MINKLPRWVEVGGFFLAFTAGSVNAIGLLGFRHQAVSHLTGTSTFLSLALAEGDAAAVLHLVIVMLAFVLGAAASGLIIGNTALKLGRSYGVALLAEAGLLLVAMWLLNRGSVQGHFFASAACGLQNAMTSTYSGAVVRTTHVSGLFTDLGVMLGLGLRGQAPDRRRVILYLTLISGFIAGGVAGAAGYLQYQFTAMLLPVSVATLLALAYGFFWWRTSQH